MPADKKDLKDGKKKVKKVTPRLEQEANFAYQKGNALLNAQKYEESLNLFDRALLDCKNHRLDKTEKNGRSIRII